MVNGGGAPLTAEELLSARPFWNVEVTAPSDEVKNEAMSLMGNSVALEFATLIYKNWISLGKPLKGNPKLKEFQKNAIILCDRLIYEYSVRLWAGSADSRLARDLINSHERFKVVDIASWKDVIDSFAAGNNAKVDKGIIYHYYCLKKIRPSFDGDGANAKYEIDHIYAQAQFNNVTTIDTMLMESLGNKSLLPKLDNISKGSKTLKELRSQDWLYGEVKRLTGINEEDIDKYSDIVNISDLIDYRVSDYKKVFEQDRITLFNSSNL